MSDYGDDNESGGNGDGCVTWLMIGLLIWGALAVIGGGLNIESDFNSGPTGGASGQRVYAGYPTAVHPDGWYSNPANFPDPTPMPTPTLRTGVHYDQFGQQVDIHPGNVTLRQRDNGGGEFIEVGGVRYFRTATGELFRVSHSSP